MVDMELKQTKPKCQVHFLQLKKISGIKKISESLFFMPLLAPGSYRSYYSCTNIIYKIQHTS